MQQKEPPLNGEKYNFDCIAMQNLEFAKIGAKLKNIREREKIPRESKPLN